MENVDINRIVEEIYTGFNSGDIDAILAHFANSVQYKILGKLVATNRDEAAEVLAGWPEYFQGAQVFDHKITSQQERADEHPGAVYCVQVTFVGSGYYVKTLDGLEGTAPATNEHVTVNFTEDIWFSGEGKVVCTSVTFNPKDLRSKQQTDK